jgi:hypothetical protein
LPRRMADAGFREQQWSRRYDPHIAPINRYVDQLTAEGGRGWAPYVAPIYGGVHARLLSVLRDPGPMTRTDVGSGFLCMENDDATAEAISRLCSDAGIDAQDIVPWNAYPWYINRAPNGSEVDSGVEPLKHVIDLLPQLRVVMLHGGSAHAAWKKLTRRYPSLVSIRKIEVVETYHTSRQAFWHRDPKVREARKEHLRNAFHRAAQHLRHA